MRNIQDTTHRPEIEITGNVPKIHRAEPRALPIARGPCLNLIFFGQFTHLNDLALCYGGEIFLKNYPQLGGVIRLIEIEEVTPRATYYDAKNNKNYYYLITANRYYGGLFESRVCRAIEIYLSGYIRLPTCLNL